jgi:transposase
MREVFNGLRWIVWAGAAWRLILHDLPPWYTVYQQSHRWLKAGVFDALVCGTDAQTSRCITPSKCITRSRRDMYASN